MFSPIAPISQSNFFPFFHVAWQPLDRNESGPPKRTRIRKKGPSKRFLIEQSKPRGKAIFQRSEGGNKTLKCAEGYSRAAKKSPSSGGVAGAALWRVLVPISLFSYIISRCLEPIAETGKRVGGGTWKMRIGTCGAFRSAQLPRISCRARFGHRQLTRKCRWFACQCIGIR